MTLPFVFVLMPFSEGFDRVYQLAIKEACKAAGANCERVDEQIFAGSIMERIYNQIEQADIVIADMTGRNPNVFYETGYAHALNKPVILLTRNVDDIPFDLKHYRHIVYKDNISVLCSALEKQVRWLIEDREEVGRRERSEKPRDRERQEKRGADKVSPSIQARQRNQVFISYSHKDLRWLQRLQVHLKSLERAGNVTRWDDTMIKPGVNWREDIRRAVESARVAVLLVSADFIASEFIYTNELPPLLAAAKEEGAVILPVIVSPSRFEFIKNISQFQAMNPPSRPLIKMNRNEQETLFVNLTEAIEHALGA